MQIASDSYGIHVLLSAIKYLDRTYGYGKRGVRRVVKKDLALHKAIGKMTDLLPDRIFDVLIEDRNDYWRKRRKAARA